MKKLVTLLTLVGVASAFSQGTINFNNRVSPGIVDAPISYNVSTDPSSRLDTVATKVNGAGTAVIVGSLNWGGQFAQAALYGGTVGTAEDSMTLLVPAVGFRTGAAAGYVNVGSSGSRTIDSVLPGGTGVFQVRAWDAGETLANNTYEAAVALGLTSHGAYYGKSTVLTIGPLGGGSPPLASPNLVGLTGFGMDFHIVPEPSIIGLGILGAAAALMVFRRRE